MPSSHEVYSEQMRTKHNGYALWRPQRPRQQPPVSVGDVGYLRDGGFVRLFNIHLAEDDPCQGELPEGFEQMIQLPDRIIEYDLRSGYIYSNAVRAISAGVQLSTGDVTFSTSKTRGAVLALPFDGRIVNCHSHEKYRKYMERHFDNWMALTKRIGLGLKDDEIVLVNGCDLAPSWAVAAFVDTKHEARLTFSGSSIAAGLSSSANFVWKDEQNVETNWGPTSTGGPASTPADQCVFLRGFHMKRSLLWPMRIKAMGRPQDLDEDSDDPPSFASTTNLLGLLSLQAGHVHEKSTPYAPFLDYILANAKCDLAIVHDDDIHPFLTENRLDLPEAITSQLALDAAIVKPKHADEALVTARLINPNPSAAHQSLSAPASSSHRLSEGDQHTLT
ncbi:hypothetical protein FA95DRAFT_1038458 [Auriscalpium vulgare]|uniref:Uncharacterized protein n=1 Tax=Auriscalpium vulgare TaxID=40419 RepID=A0ACB8RXZ7_9AGAM|nr:hypothetical protein FA95DRAFT_1038458 [Auriscalpium vulgare]